MDRIRFFERNPHIYRTKFHWDANGEMSAWPIEDPDGVAERRWRASLKAQRETISARRVNLVRLRQKAVEHRLGYQMGEYLL